MCGFSGFLAKVPLAYDVKSTLCSMAKAISHRGPDDEGIWFEPQLNVGLAHRRLSIVELSEAGHQPMISASGRYVIAFNGEIYNHLELRQELECCGMSTQWRGHSDTETLLASFDTFGVLKTIEKATGMFAFAVWDRLENTLSLARDRLGEKPLYYGWQDDVFLFGSELKSLKSHPAFKAHINRGAVSLLLRHSYIPAPHSIYEGIYKLLPGTLLETSAVKFSSQVITYWSATEVAKQGLKNQFQGSAAEAVDVTESLLSAAVKRQMMADVPLGAFLSGGIDSTTIVALIQSQSARPVKTFTIGFQEAQFNEAIYAKDVAAHLGTEHTELYVHADDALNVIPKLPHLYDEPFADPSQIPTFLVSQLAAKHVTVCLSGDGGDELFCGYNRYNFTERLWKKLKLIPRPMRQLIGQGLLSVSPHQWDAIGKMLPKEYKPSSFGDKLHRGAGVLQSTSVDQLYYGLVSHTKKPEHFIVGGYELPTFLTGNRPDLGELGEIERMMILDQITYLPDDILVKVDRAAMGVSLETRVPFLDHHLVEFAARLPLNVKKNDNQSKWPLKKILYKYVPGALIERPKMGFGVPLAEWFRGPLKVWVEELLSEDRLRREGIFNSEPIQKIWREHLSGKRNWAYLLWNIVVFQSWLETQR